MSETQNSLPGTALIVTSVAGQTGDVPATSLYGFVDPPPVNASDPGENGQYAVGPGGFYVCSDGQWKLFAGEFVPLSDFTSQLGTPQSMLGNMILGKA